MKHLLLLICTMALCAVAIPTANNYRLHERRDFTPEAWTQWKKLDGDTLLPVRIGLTQSNLGQGHDLLMELYVFPLSVSVTH